MENSLVESFYNYGNFLTKHASDSTYVGLRRFKAFFGVSPSICAKAWIYLKDDLPDDYHEIHLLWALLFLKCYNTEHVNHAIAGSDEKTSRKRIWVVIEKLAFIKVIEWEDRKLGAAEGQTTYTSLDGTDFKINEPKPFDPKWFSHKIKHAGLRYEIALSLRKGHIVWAFGSYLCGDWPDLKLAKESFVDFLEPNERSVADRLYFYFIFPRLPVSHID